MQRPPFLRIHQDEIIIDAFAGGGGASLGIEMALGRSPDIAINHDPEALAMHRANHPTTQHFVEDVRDVDPTVVCGGRKVGLAWFSPDCTHFSRARNGSIKRDKAIRCLANVAIRWAAAVRPRVILVECVRELEDWGPLDDDGQPDKARAGEDFEFWWDRLEALGYRISKRVLKACDFGAPTSRERLFIIARCDDVDPEACWPVPSHGPGRAEPYRTAADCIDFALPCPSIFMTKRQARKFTKETGIRCKRPLADKTMLRIRRGIYKYVLNCAKPFTIRLTGDDARVYDLHEPMRTVTAANRGEFGLVTPLVTPVKTWGGGGNDPAPADRPLRTVTTSKRGEFGLVMPFLARTAHGDVGKTGKPRYGHAQHTVDHPLPTVTGSRDFALVAPTLIQTGYGEREGQAPRCLDIKAPLGTIIAGGAGHGNGKHAVVQSRLERADKVAAFIYKGFGDDSPKRTGGFPGAAPVDRPLGTITTRDHQQLALSHLVKFRGTSSAHMDSSSMPVTEPMPTISTGKHTTGTGGGSHFGHVRAFLTRYNGESIGQVLSEPLTTIDTRDRFGLVVVDGVEYVIADIGLRMLTPRELYNAQGFPRHYIIDPVVTTTTKRGKVKTGPLSATAQIEKCGNSVAPPVAAALAYAVFTAVPMAAAA